MSPTRNPHAVPAHVLRMLAELGFDPNDPDNNNNSCTPPPEQHQEKSTPPPTSVDKTELSLDERILAAREEERRVLANPTSRVPENCLHAIKAWMKSPTSQQPVGKCPCCYAELDIKGLLPTKPNIERRPAMAFWCTHLMCTPCFEQMFFDLSNNGQDPGALLRLSCPMCRTPCRATECHHPILGIEIPTSDTPIDTVTSTKATIPEGGGPPALCHDCGHRKWVKEYFSDEEEDDDDNDEYDEEEDKEEDEGGSERWEVIW